MYKLIIVDDEPLALRNMEILFDWETLGFQLETTFDDGQAAMDYLTVHPVDLVISDIKMPQKSGLDLARLCYELYPNTWFIFISAHRDFQYAQEATRYNVVEYITKPFLPSTLKNAVSHAFKKLSTADNSATGDEDISVLRKKMLTQLLNGNVAAVSASSHTEMYRAGLAPDMFTYPCAILTLRLQDLQDYMDHHWKHGGQRLFRALSLLLPADQRLTCMLISHASDTVDLAFFQKQNYSSFSEDVHVYTQRLQSSILSVLLIHTELLKCRFFPCFEQMRGFLVGIDKAVSSGAIINKVEEYVQAHYHENISLREVANYVALSPSYFSAFFKQHTNETFVSYLKKIRLEKALMLLRDTDLPINSICGMVGYKNMSHFYDLIKSGTNMTPNDYRLLQRKKEQNNA